MSEEQNKLASNDPEGRRPLVYLTRIEQFSAAHRLHNCGWNEEKNRAVFGKCDHLHGHNYKLEVTVKGPVDGDQTGMVMNIALLKELIGRSVLSLLDHRNIDADVPYFAEHISTSECLAVFIWQQLAAEMPPTVRLHRVKLHETEKNVVEFCGEFV
ncbi:hypothetical protein TYRP_002207 [Tyrophagus putrescentiae]|nr:hypothetical protein TYRP_002207 [Tyrophagus putrescentiae]